MPALLDWDLRGCLILNTLSCRPHVRRFFAGISRLGDGGFWFMIMAIVCWTPSGGPAAAGRMLLAAALGSLIYKVLKVRIGRRRPCDSSQLVLRTVEPLDQWSFPSGHSMHALSFTILACSPVPWLMVLLVPFTLMILASRLVLGLHYPSDVLAGSLLGGVLGAVVLQCT